MRDDARPGLLSRTLRVVGIVEDAVLGLLLSAMILLAGLQIVLRNVAETGIVWGDAFLRVLVLWVGLLGAVAATRDYNHITVDVVSRFLPPRAKDASRIAIDLFTAIVAALIAVAAARLVLADRAQGTIAFAAVKVWTCELILPLGFGVIALRYVLFLVRHVVDTVRGGAPL
jgi:TRAP-type C4-dicarboxylate transport system permease small subunit